MRVAYIADGRAEHARRWVRDFGQHGDAVLFLSTYPCDPIENVDIRVLPGLFRPGNTFVKSSEQADQPKTVSLLGRLVRTLVKYGADSLIRPLWHRLSSVDVIWQARAANRILNEFQPDLVHAHRIPNETFVLARVSHEPKISSVWGQDFIYNCRHYSVHRWLTKWSLPRVQAMTADCQRDLELCKNFGYQGDFRQYFPTNGGVDTQLFSMGLPSRKRPQTLIYARGYGPYLRPDTLFEAVKNLIPQFPQLCLRIIAPTSQMDFMRSRMEHFQIPPANYKIEPFQTQQEWAKTLQSATAFVSPSVSDGTPNGMLEAMACGAIPIMGDIESVREWIDHKRNGLLFDADSVPDLMDCLSICLEDSAFADDARLENQKLIFERCARETVLPRIRKFYEEVVELCKQN